MNNFIFDELSAAEYRSDRMQAAEEYRRIAQISKKNITLSVYRSLAKLGVLLENWGARMQTRYNCLALREKHEMLANSAK